MELSNIRGNKEHMYMFRLAENHRRRGLSFPLRWFDDANSTPRIDRGPQ